MQIRLQADVDTAGGKARVKGELPSEGATRIEIASPSIRLDELIGGAPDVEANGSIEIRTDPKDEDVLAVAIETDGFTYDPGVGEFFLSHPKIRIPERGGIYSINEGNYHSWHEGIQRWVDWIKTPSEGKKAYRLRYIGAMVADLHRTLLRGGIFVYPQDVKNEKGKLRLLYEASPMAFLVEAAGGAASDGTQRILDIEPHELHQRTPLYLGNKRLIEDVETELRNAL